VPNVFRMDYTEEEKKRKAEEDASKNRVDREVEQIHRKVDSDEKKLQEAEGPQPGGGEPSGHS